MLQAPGGRVDVAIVVTVKDDPRVLDCVDAVLVQRAPFPFEVVVVDNGSHDRTPDLLHQRYEDNPRVRLLQSGGNLSEAWNKAAIATDAAVLVRVDADVVPLEGWLVAIAEPILSGSADWAAGPVSGSNADASLVARYFHERTEAYSRRLASDLALRDAVPSWNVAYQRSALERAGWYDPWQASSVDWDLHKRFARAGLTGTFVPGARVLHTHPTTVRELMKKEAWYRTGQYQMVLKYGFREMMAAFLIPAAYALLILLTAFGFVWSISWWFALLLLVSLITKHWIEGLREADPLWPYRAVFRPIEAIAGLAGLGRGILRYGLRARPLPASSAPPTREKP